MGAEPAKITVGFHELFRYSIPGYAFLITAFLVFATVGETEVFQDLAQIVISILAGPPVGFLIHWIYYCGFSWYYTRHSSAYQEIRKEVEEYIENHEVSDVKGLKEEFSKHKVLVIRCLWDNVFFSKNLQNEMRDRIQFLFTTFHSIGSVFAALWLGFFVGIFSLLVLGKINFPVEFSFSWLRLPLLWVFAVIGGVSLFLVKSYRLRYNLGTFLEFFAVIKLRKLIIEEIKVFSVGLDKTKEKKQLG